MVAYAARHGEQKIPHGSVRQRVALHRSTPSRAGTTGTPQAPRLTGDPERRLLRAQERLPMAAFAPRLPALEDRLRLVQEVAHRRDVGAPERWAARALAVAGREGPAPQRRHRRLPVCEDDGGGWGAKGLRRRQEGARPKAIPAGGHGGLVLEAKVHSAKVPDQDGIGLLP